MQDRLLLALRYRRVYTLHGFADQVAADLRYQGLWREPVREGGRSFR